MSAFLDLDNVSQQERQRWMIDLVTGGNADDLVMQLREVLTPAQRIRHTV